MERMAVALRIAEVSTVKINLLEYFMPTVEKNTDKIAILDGEKTITFGELDNSSRRLASHIIQVLGGKIRRPIAVYMSKSIECITSDIAIIYSGNAYMNLDVKNPATRISAILDRIQPELVITNSEYIDNLNTLFDSRQIINIDNYSETIGGLASRDQRIRDTLSKIIDTDPLCIINTSGSTGTPKGVVLNHRSFIDFVEWADDKMHFSDKEILGCLSPSVFDIYSYELCLMMQKGSRMVLLDENAAAFPARLLQVLQKTKTTFIFWVPTIMVTIANMGLLDRISLPDLQTVWFAGEVFPTKQFNIWRHALPKVRFVNMYGPIEITLDCTHYIVERELQDNEPIPIGYAMRNTDILLLNDNDELCGVNEPGELCVRGTSLAMGYYNNPEKTAAAFVQNPLNHSYPEIIYRTGDIASINEYGEIMYRGRRDTLVKHSGYRIELTEIEHVIINNLKLVKNCCVVYDSQRKNIVLFYENDCEVPTLEFREKISSVLPKYMVPNRFVFLVEMPRNPNGKIDRLRLKESL